jgi:hypothetical protein
VTQSTRGNPPKTFSRFTAPKRERLSTGRGEGAVVQIGSKPFLVVSKLRGDDSPKWREDPTVSAVLKAVARDHGDYRPLTDYRLIKVQSTGRPGWYVYLCSRPQEQQISRLVRSVRERYAAADDMGMVGAVALPVSRLRHRSPVERRGRGGLTRANAVRRGR